MPGTIVFKPLEVNLSKDPSSNSEPYCTFTLGDQRAERKISENSGKDLGKDSVAFKVKYQPICLVEIKSQEKSNDYIGNFEIDLHEIETNGKLKKWFTIFNEDKSAGELLMEATFTSEIYPSEESEKAAQGNIPAGIDIEKYSLRAFHRDIEPENSRAKIAETNEFGDYQPEKQLRDPSHQIGSGKIEQGQYYSGEQTSYGEAYPMAHKSVAANISTFEEGGVIPRGENPLDFSRFQNQAFVPHNKTDGKANSSVVEKAFMAAKKQENQKKRGLDTHISGNRGVYNPAANLTDEADINANLNTDEKKPTFPENPDESTTASVTDLIAENLELEEISKGVGQPTSKTVFESDFDNTAFRDLKNSQQKF